MRGSVVYYSATGNTALACRYLTQRMPVPFDVVDVTLPARADVPRSDVVVFACPTDFWGVPRAFESFIEALPEQHGTPAFVLNTFGAFSGRTLRVLAEHAAARGFDVLGGYSLHMPESYPPMIARGMGAPGAPGDKALAGFEAFVAKVATAVGSLERGERPEKHALRLGLADRLMSPRRRTTARDDMGVKTVDAAACTRCGTCRKNCPYGAIALDPTPVFDMAKCYGCWRCYNLCPNGAISTAKFHGGPFYRRPSRALEAKLTTETGGRDD